MVPVKKINPPRRCGDYVTFDAFLFHGGALHLPLSLLFPCNTTQKGAKRWFVTKTSLADVRGDRQRTGNSPNNALSGRSIGVCRASTVAGGLAGTPISVLDPSPRI